MNFSISREIKTAVLVIAAIAAFVWGLRYLQDKELFTNYRTYYAIFDNVEGLEKGAAVTISGLKIGSVDAIAFNDDKAHVKVTMNVKDKFQFSETSRVVINGGIIGGSTMKIVPDFENTQIAKTGFTFKGESSGMMDMIKDAVGDKLSSMEKQVDSLLTNTNKLVVNINDVMDDKTKNNIKQSLAELRVTLTHFKNVAKKTDDLLADNKDKLSRTLTNTEKITADLAKVTQGLSEADFKKSMQDLEATIASFKNLAAGMEKGEGSIGKLMKDDELYNNLTGSSKQLEELLKEMKLHPKRFVHFSLFGKKAKPYKTEEIKK